MALGTLWRTLRFANLTRSSREVVYQYIVREHAKRRVPLATLLDESGVLWP